MTGSGAAIFETGESIFANDVAEIVEEPRGVPADRRRRPVPVGVHRRQVRPRDRHPEHADQAQPDGHPEPAPRQDGQPRRLRLRRPVPVRDRLGRHADPGRYRGLEHGQRRPGCSTSCSPALSSTPSTRASPSTRSRSSRSRGPGSSPRPRSSRAGPARAPTTRS
ncbi:hypothetical protein G5V59_00235 [Nocardioides sp. W3-2-3]|uniref:hypothetical protein n=1 Tax=Nocardioides convexus TaxID=2712224 RepID=UPI002418AD2D|nr:hypothetical protein [Nocardioides convexus]NGZ99401.1 hypothetical protein [Nocardioides convexus]